MDIGSSTTYACDTCGAVAPGYTRRLPEGWSRSRWHTGILDTMKLPPPDRHYCSKACHMKGKERLAAAKES